jgi:hypothetical protein
MWQKKIFASATILLVALMGAFPAVGLLAGESSTDTMDLSTRESSILEAYGKLPLLFIENQGQVDEAVRYYVKASGQTVYFTEENIVFELIRYDGAEAERQCPDLQRAGLQGHLPQYRPPALWQWWDAAL